MKNTTKTHCFVQGKAVVFAQCGSGTTFSQALLDNSHGIGYTYILDVGKTSWHSVFAVTGWKESVCHKQNKIWGPAMSAS